MPDRRKVPLDADQLDGQGQSKAHNKLGGKSEKTKEIRSATPRGFAEAVFRANAPHLKKTCAIESRYRGRGFTQPTLKKTYAESVAGIHGVGMQQPLAL